jgi:hypothetical protein
MAIHLDHTRACEGPEDLGRVLRDDRRIDRQAGGCYFAQVQVSDSLTFNLADEPEPWGGPGFDPRTGDSHHYAFPRQRPGVRQDLRRVKANGIPYGSGPDHYTDGQIYSRRGGRGFYFEDSYGHLPEDMTVPETGS